MPKNPDRFRSVKTPNIVFILTDDQGYGDLGCHGNNVIQTPHIDRFYNDAVRFNNYHVGSTCAPTRAGILTGHYCNSAGVWHTIGGRSLLRADEWTLADALSSAGYQTGHFGKWHLGDSQPFRPHERGFHETIYHAGGGIGNTGDPWGNDYFDDTYFHNGTPKQFKGYCTDVFFREGMRFIEKNANRPFFCYIATNAPHGPLNIEPHYVDIYRDSTPHEDRARFYGMITNIDENFGLVETCLENLEIMDNTIVIFMTDNGTASGVELDGDEFPIEGLGSFNAGMRGIKGSQYEGGHRVPFLIRYPDGKITDGRDVDILASYVDVMPTLLDLCGIQVPKKQHFHGHSLAPLLRGKPPTTELTDRFNVCDTQRTAHPVKWRRSSVMKCNWRLIDGYELYDLAKDPGQRQDVASNYPEVTSELRADYEHWWDMVSEQFDRDQPIALGQNDESVKLTTHDIRNADCSAVWNHRQVRFGQITNGYWAIEVKTAGQYEIELRRWPEETSYALTAGIDGDDSDWRRDCIQEKHAPAYENGVALNLKSAHINIGGHNLYRDIDMDAEAVIFSVELSAGKDQLCASFQDYSKHNIAPYYVYVRRRPL